MKDSDEFTVLLASLPRTTVIYPGGAVVGYSEHWELTNVGNYVQFSASLGEVCVYMHARHIGAVEICIYDNYIDKCWSLGCLLQCNWRDETSRSVLYNYLNTWTALVFKYAMSTAVHYSHLLVCFSLFLLTALVILSLLYMNAHPHVFLGVLTLRLLWRGNMYNHVLYVISLTTFML